MFQTKWIIKTWSQRFRCKSYTDLYCSFNYIKLLFHSFTSQQPTKSCSHFPNPSSSAFPYVQFLFISFLPWATFPIHLSRWWELHMPHWPFHFLNVLVFVLFCLQQLSSSLSPLPRDSCIHHPQLKLHARSYTEKSSASFSGISFLRNQRGSVQNFVLNKTHHLFCDMISTRFIADVSSVLELN